MRYTQTKTEFTIVDDNIDATFKSLGNRDENLSFTIEGAEQFIMELNQQIIKAKQARIKIIANEIKALMDDIVVKQQVISRKESDLKNLREQVGVLDDKQPNK